MRAIAIVNSAGQPVPISGTCAVRRVLSLGPLIQTIHHWLAGRRRQGRHITCPNSPLKSCLDDDECGDTDGNERKCVLSVRL